MTATVDANELATLSITPEEILSIDEDVIIITGAAGTGKTTKTANIARLLMDLSIQVVALAPTGKAARVLENKANIPVATIHSAIYTCDDEQSDTNATIFKLKSCCPEDDETFQVVILEEGSLIGDKDNKSKTLIYGSGRLLHDVVRSFKIGTRKNTKLIVVGDDNQLPPIGADFSPALCPQYLEDTYELKSITFELNENYRQKEAPEIMNFISNYKMKGGLDAY